MEPSHSLQLPDHVADHVVTSVQEACVALSTAKAPRKAAPLHSSVNGARKAPGSSLVKQAALAGLLALGLAAAVYSQTLQVCPCLACSQACAQTFMARDFRSP